MKYLLLVSYDGTCFSGWQRQPAKRTVQLVLEEAGEALFHASCPMTASGRTDAGVHALGQVVSFGAETKIPASRLAPCFNRLLPSDVRVRASAEAEEDFDLTREAKKKTYRYTAYFAPTELPLAARYACRLSARPDLAKMEAAAQLLVGEHDFAAFRAADFTSKTSTRTIYSVKLEERHENGGTFYEIYVTGSGFLYHMVRILAGELFAVGCGKEEGITRAFQSGRRSALAKTMPPQGLTLMEVDYGRTLF